MIMGIRERDANPFDPRRVLENKAMDIVRVYGIDFETALSQAHAAAQRRATEPTRRGKNRKNGS